jgi:hypothetical protein
MQRQVETKQIFWAGYVEQKILRFLVIGCSHFGADDVRRDLQKLICWVELQVVPESVIMFHEQIEFF